ncbi:MULTISPECIES: GntR family transcriptional regulator [unclassified Streptomyces]|uniref:GntR family transcriptional regulator n=1 Tax=unclassified Streptomyces TaxID=2593676 RepID=UPI002238EDC4|nr:GntR family transcriptional regulator [Streptomyces sp. SHP 1-2]MCW5249768.1 GntR family transcriptional regulator [Streptomyces sp. SHP 1-2]
MEGDVVEYRIDRRSGVPAYVQIVRQTEQALRMGVLQVGDKLPTAKEVVAATAINPNTVFRAYRDLEQAGLVRSRRGLGTFVTRSLARPGAEDDSPLRAELARWIGRARETGLDRDDVLALVTAALDEHERSGDARHRPPEHHGTQERDERHQRDERHEHDPGRPARREEDI